jgi:multicomponent K+:H+ antiporter subunit E
MKRWLPHPILSVALMVLWLLLANQFNFAHLLLGAFLGWAIPLFTSDFWQERATIRQPITLVRFGIVVLYDIVVANVSVARLILGPGERLQPAFMVMPLRLRTDLAISVLANTISLTPGTVSAFVSADRRSLVIHTLHTTSPEQVIADIRERYEQPLLEALD